MNYFTADLFRASQSRDRETAARAGDEWEERLRAYEESLAELTPRLRKCGAHDLLKMSLHDAKVLNIVRYRSSRERQLDLNLLLPGEDRQSGHLLTLSYNLVAADSFTMEPHPALEPRGWYLLYDELEADAESATHSLLTNIAVLTIRFTKVASHLSADPVEVIEETTSSTLVAI